jgi:hypothetical protein
VRKFAHTVTRFAFLLLALTFAQFTLLACVSPRTAEAGAAQTIAVCKQLLEDLGITEAGVYSGAASGGWDRDAAGFVAPSTETDGVQVGETSPESSEILRVVGTNDTRNRIVMAAGNNGLVSITDQEGYGLTITEGVAQSTINLEAGPGGIALDTNGSIRLVDNSDGGVQIGDGALAAGEILAVTGDATRKDITFNPGASGTVTVTGDFQAASGVIASGPYYFDALTGVKIQSGSATPEGSKNAPPGSIYLQNDASAPSAMAFLKGSGTSNTGWLAMGPVTAWTSFTPTSPTWTSNVTLTGFYRRVGDTAEIRVQVAVTGAPGTTGSTEFRLDPPTGLTIDTNKLFAAAASWCGSGWILDAGTANRGGIMVRYLGAGYFDVTYMNAVTTVTPVTTTLPQTFANGDYINLYYSAPITGW